MSELTFGTDFETFLIVNQERIVPVGGGLIDGTKLSPHSLGSGFFIQEDGVTIEMNTPVRVCDGEASVSEDMAAATKRALIYLRKKLAGQDVSARAHDGLTVSRVELDRRGAVTFEQSQLLAVGKPAFTVGCDPDFSAYAHNGMLPNDPPNINEWGNTRFAGGHLHLGYDTSIIPPHVMVRLLDLKVAEMNSWDGSPRANVYGQPGRFRHKPYGLEYRSLTTDQLYNLGDELVRWAKRLLDDVSIAERLYDVVNWTEFFAGRHSDRRATARNVMQGSAEVGAYAA